jgi:hypothetical protein
MASVLLLLALTINCIQSCHSPKKTASKNTQKDMAPGNMTPFDDQNWSEGPSVLNKKELLAALQRKNENGKRRLWRLPVVIELEEDGLRGIKSAYIGIDVNVLVADQIQLRLQDGALGVSLQERIRQYCPTGSVCKLWVAGFWGTDMPTTIGNEGDLDAEKPFALRAVLGKQQGDWASDGNARSRFRDQ